MKISQWLLATVLCAGMAVGAVAKEPVNRSKVKNATDKEVFAVPAWNKSFSLAQSGRTADTLLLGVQNQHYIDFGLRKDRLVGSASLELKFTPSPALIPSWSHLRVYLNDVLMGTVRINKEDLGRQTTQNLALNSFLLSDFNRVRIEFVGHYTEVCEDQANNSLWLSISSDTKVHLNTQAVATRNDLSFFPLPFFDPSDQDKTRVHMVFAATPNAAEQQAAGVLASFIGSVSGWRGAEFPVLYNQLPTTGERRQLVSNSIVFATNANRPEFMQDTELYPDVDAPVITLMNHPEHAYSKILLLMGRDEQDLHTAALALASQSPLLRGQQVKINKLEVVEPRKPYDAPNWVATDRPVRFAELIDYPEQLHAQGMRPEPIQIELNLPPDLFIWRNQGIPLATSYRYTKPLNNDESRLSFSINGQFISSTSLNSNSESSLEKVRLGITSKENTNSLDKLRIPSLKLGARNTLRYDFSFASTVSSVQKDQCQTALPLDVRAVIDENSTIDLSGYSHFMPMPDLQAFSGSGFPFSRMADLSETQVVTLAQPNPEQVSTLLQIIAGIGAQTGYPALALQVTDNWQAASKKNADLLVLGNLAPEMDKSAAIQVAFKQNRDWLLHSFKQPLDKQQRYNADAFTAQTEMELLADAPIAAIVGMQSPFNKKRSVVAFLADTPADFQLLKQALQDNVKMAAVSGSTALIRESGVHSQLVGEQYYVGHVSWLTKIWYVMSERPFMLLFATLIAALLASFVLYQILRWQAARRLQED